MKLRNALHWLVLAALVFTVGCAKDEGPVFVPGPPPVVGEPIDTAYFNTEVLPIFTEHCWNCHPTMAELDLGVTEAYNNLVNVPSVNHAPAIRVVPGDPAASVMWHKVSGSPTYGLNMPPNGTTLSAEELQLIYDWIEQGAMNN
ncbi:MAG: hypothetical protein IPI00_12395 [Flavobacteriales bacterium]|nr:hypothetical protein [Flavobacteriales bacterium]MBK6943172.1 hypothetical protein [Flavobacteriales bacterium]MBK7240949.1 hypothetical protein [Flavobacteriales bacterium]MBK9536298.1 hypothetical protein [Flavobacteriales bacterium]MBP9137961.1 hypothetical protein [Flavobacteriales bacterium]